MAIITLTSDFGLTDGYVGAMKGVILGIAPDSRLVDLSHETAPQAVRQAEYLLARTTPYFPPQTIHLAVVDPGVGSERRPLVVTTLHATFVGPDNGLFTFALEQPGATAWTPDRPEYWLPGVSRTFHGRDIFAPCAAHLARGVPVHELASPLADPVRLPSLRPERTGNGRIRGHVIYIDRFGNLITNVPGEWFSRPSVPPDAWSCEIAGQQIAGLSATYATVGAGELVLLVSSGGTAEIAVRNGSAAQRLGVEIGAAVLFTPG